MTFLEFWKHDLSRDEIKAIEIIEHQIIALDKEWSQFEKHNFIDWNVKFKGLHLSEIDERMQIPMRDADIEKKEFQELWNKTTKLFSKTVKLIEKGKKQDAIILLYSEIKDFEKDIQVIENQERKTIGFLQRHYNLFKPLFDNNYGNGYFEDVLENYEVRFKILEILMHEYELIRYMLSDFV
ncbi:MAG: hypothetical protein ACOC2U_02545 [bacterium]